MDSPSELQVTAMQIDTWNRDEMNISGPLPPKFVPGPLPKASQAPVENPLYSGLLECPMTTRITRQVDGTSSLQSQGTCGQLSLIATAEQCFMQAYEVLNKGSGMKFINNTVADVNRPVGCSVNSDPADPLVTQVYFNTHDSEVPCAGYY